MVSFFERRIDAMSNEEYQYLLRLPASELRDALAGRGRERPGISRLLRHLDDDAVAASLRNLGGHDLGDLLEAFAAADRATDRPSVVLAYTIKAWRLPTEGHPGNHSALLSVEQWRRLGPELGADPDVPWAKFPPDSPEGMACAAAAHRLARPSRPPGTRSGHRSSSASPTGALSRPSKPWGGSCSTSPGWHPRSPPGWSP